MRVLISVFAAALALMGVAQKGIDKQELIRLNKLDATFTSTKAALAKAPKDAAKKKAFITAAMKAGNAFQETGVLAPNIKYPKSLNYFRAVLKVDPKHKDAKMNVDRMVAIYKSMGKPVPPEK